MHILVLEPIPESAIDWLRAKGATVALAYGGDQWELVADLVDALIVRIATIDADLLDRLPRLRVIGKFGVGVDSIDLTETDRRGIKVTSIPGVNANSVAELAVSLLAATARDLLTGDAMVREGRFAGRVETRMKQDLTASRIGLVGAGRIGTRIGEICRGGWDCEIGAYDPFADDAAIERLRAIRLSSIDELFAWADHVFVAAPRTDRTTGLITTAQLDLLGPNGIVVVSSRGGIVDEAALAAAVGSGAIFGAGVDVFDLEPPAPDNPLLAIDHVILSPHLGGHTRKTRDAMGMAVASQVVSLLNGGDAPLVDATTWS